MSAIEVARARLESISRCEHQWGQSQGDTRRCRRCGAAQDTVDQLSLVTLSQPELVRCRYCLGRGWTTCLPSANNGNATCPCPVCHGMREVRAP